MKTSLFYRSRSKMSSSSLKRGILKMSNTHCKYRKTGASNGSPADFFATYL